VFVGINATTGYFPSEATRLLCKQLERNGLETAHLIHIIKGRTPGDQLDGVRQNERARTSLASS
jgi:hypothetical protein